MQTVEPLPLKLPPVLGDKSLAVQPNHEILMRLLPALIARRKELSAYSDDTLPITAEDQALRENMDAVRLILESVYGEPLCFTGENRHGSPVKVEGKIDVELLLGRVSVVDADHIRSGDIHAQAKVDTIGSSGVLSGVKAKIIGSGRREIRAPLGARVAGMRVRVIPLLSICSLGCADKRRTRAVQDWRTRPPGR